MSHQPSMKDWKEAPPINLSDGVRTKIRPDDTMTNSTRYNNTLVDEYYRGFKEGEEHAKQRILIEMLPYLNDTQQRRLRKILEDIDETPD